MPLRAICDTGNLHAFEYDADQWKTLKANYRSIGGLRMPCCNAVAVPKTSPRGTFFFAHARKGECTTAPESDEHLWCKQVVALAATSAGWNVSTELRGQTPEGQEWIADVFSQRGTAKIAFEIQMSPQTLEETERRQVRYRESGVRGAWFFSPRIQPHGIAHSKDLPAFVLSPFEIGEVPIVQGFDVQLSEFVSGMLTKRLEWVIPEINKPTYVEVIEDTCWACEKPVKQIFGHFSNLKPGEDPYQEEWIERYFTVAQMSIALEKVLKVVPNPELRAAGLNLIITQDVIKGKRTNWPYCNACIHCKAPQNNYFVGTRLQKIYYEENREALGLSLIKFDRITQGTGHWIFKPLDTNS
jgi:hypothetical protein